MGGRRKEKGGEESEWQWRFSTPLHWYRIPRLGALKGKISKEKVLVNGSDEVDIKCFLFYVENVADNAWAHH